MKKIVLLLVAIVLYSCEKKPLNEYVSIEGKIENHNNASLTIMGKNFKKEIKVNDDGTFEDTLKVADGFHGYTDGVIRSYIYLKNGYDLDLNFDTKDIPSSISFSGIGSGTNIYLMEKLKFIKEEKIDNSIVFFELDKAEFDAKMSEITNRLEELLNDANNLDPEVLKLEQENNTKLLEFFNSNYSKEHNKYAALKKGAPSPKFNYPNTEGQNVSLDEFLGKYVYIDVWATWCAPCKKEIPYLKELNKEYKDKNIAIVSLSIDKQENKDKWKKMVADENLSGIQIIANNDDFATAYDIKGIPRFILIDDKGNILDANAPRPSDPRLKEVFNNLNL